MWVIFALHPHPSPRGERGFLSGCLSQLRELFQFLKGEGLFGLEQRFAFGDDVFDGEAKEREEFARWCGFAKGVDADDGATVAADAAPRQGNARFDDHGRHAFGQDLLAIAGILLLVDVEARQRNDLDAQAVFAQFGSGSGRECDFGAGSGKDEVGFFCRFEDVAAFGDGFACRFIAFLFGQVLSTERERGRRGLVERAAPGDEGFLLVAGTPDVQVRDEAQ